MNPSAWRWRARDRRTPTEPGRDGRRAGARHRCGALRDRVRGADRGARACARRADDVAQRCRPAARAHPGDAGRAACRRRRRARDSAQQARDDLERFDRVLGSAEAIGDAVSNTVARTAFSSPAIKAVGFAKGTSRAWRRLRRDVPHDSLAGGSRRTVIATVSDDTSGSNGGVAAVRRLDNVRRTSSGSPSAGVADRAPAVGDAAQEETTMIKRLTWFAGGVAAGLTGAGYAKKKVRETAAQLDPRQVASNAAGAVAYEGPRGGRHDPRGAGGDAPARGARDGASRRPARQLGRAPGGDGRGVRRRDARGRRPGRGDAPRVAAPTPDRSDCGRDVVGAELAARRPSAGCTPAADGCAVCTSARARVGCGVVGSGAGGGRAACGAPSRPGAFDGDGDPSVPPRRQQHGARAGCGVLSGDHRGCAGDRALCQPLQRAVRGAGIGDRARRRGGAVTRCDRDLDGEDEPRPRGRPRRIASHGWNPGCSISICRGRWPISVSTSHPIRAASRPARSVATSPTTPAARTASPTV